MSNKTQLEKLASFFSTEGKTLTAKQAQSMFGVERMSARIYDLRQMGYCIYSNPRKGSQSVEYRSGRPTRSMVSAAHQVLGESAFAA
jgi:hypothetical protein